MTVAPPGEAGSAEEPQLAVVPDVARTVAPETEARSTHPRQGDRSRELLGSIEEGVERMLFASRWLLAPLYVGLVGALLVIIIKFTQAFWDLASHAVSDDLRQVTLGLLELLDITLLANLVLIVVFAGYENFVSKIGVAQGSEDRPHWMGHVDYSGLKMKLIGSIVAISVIGLLQDFLATGPTTFHDERWRIAIHLTFLASGVLFALMDLLAERRMAAERIRERAEM